MGFAMARELGQQVGQFGVGSGLHAADQADEFLVHLVDGRVAQQVHIVPVHGLLVGVLLVAHVSSGWSVREGRAVTRWRRTAAGPEV